MPQRKISKSYSIMDMNKTLHISLVRMNIPDSMSFESNIKNSYNSTEVVRTEEANNCVIDTQKNLNTVTNNGHDFIDDSDYTSDSNTSNISKLKVLNAAFKDAVRDDSICLSLADNADLSFNMSHKRINESSKTISSRPLPELSNCTENDTITIKIDKTYDDKNEYSSIRDDSQSQSQEIYNLSCRNQSQDVSNLYVQSNTNRSQNNSIAVINSAPDDDQMFVVPSNQEIRKKHFCFYCKTFQTVTSRHLPAVHKDEPEVRELLMFKPKSKERRELINSLRLKGDYLFNSTSGLNNGEKLVTRQPNAKNPKKASEYETCHKCLGAFYSIDRHTIKCLGESSKYHRSSPTLSRAVADHIHKNSSQKLRKLFSVMKDDEVARVLRYDALLISFGNELCDKYTEQQQHDIIRSRLRDLGKLILKVRENQNVKYIHDFSSLIDPQMYKYILEAIKEITGADSDNQSCQASSTALSYGIYIKKIAQCYRRQCLEDGEYDNLKIIEYFLQLHEDKYPIAMNKLAHEFQTVNKRHKKVVLPLITIDIKIFWSYVRKQYHKALTNLNTQYSDNDYDDLNKSTFLLVLIFNRNRPEELERVTINDYESATKFSESNKEDYEKLSEENKKFVNEYIKFDLGEKKDRNVPVIISREMRTGIDTLLKYRNHTGICSHNPMIFALPGTEIAGRYKHLRIRILMREFSEKSNVSYPKALRTTTLRKHVATTVASMNIAESRIYDISNFMGHTEAIHRQHYQQAVVSRDLCEVPQILKVAVGMRQDAQTATFNSNAIATCDNDATQSRLIDERQSDVETIESKDDMRNDSNDPEDSIVESTKRCTKKRKINEKRNETSKKIRWNEYEINTTSAVFEKNVMNMKLPSSFEIREFLKKYPNIMRTEAQIRTWVHNQYKVRQQRLRY